MSRKSFTRRALLGGGLTLGLGAVGGSAWALDRFVIDKAEVTNVSDIPVDDGLPTSTASPSASASSSASASADPSTSASPSAATTPVLTATSYTTDLYELTLTSHTSGSGSSALAWYAAELKASSATVLRSAFAEDTFGQNIVQMPSEIASAMNAIWAVNGDYYGFRSSGITIRNGIKFRDEGARQGAVLTRDGELKIYDETATSADQLIADGAWHTLSFGPALLNNGQILDGIDSVEIDTNFGNRTIQGNQPRTGFGMIAANHFVTVVVDGRSAGYSEGVTMTGFAEIFQSLGAQTAYNLDGGGSSVMFFNDDMVNNPRGRGEERETSDIFYLAK